MRSYFQIGAVLAAVAATFGTTLHYGFLGFDDGIHVTANPLLYKHWDAFLIQAFTQPFQKVFMPVTLVVWEILAKISFAITGGLNPGFFHGANLALHLVNTLLVWLCLGLLVSRKPVPRILGTLFFALHPLQVESVAWISSLKDLLGSFFSLLAFYEVARQVENPNEDSGSVSGFFTGLLYFALAVFSKVTSVAMLPALAVIATRGKRTPPPFFWVGTAATAVLGVALTLRFQSDLGFTTEKYGLLTRLSLLPDTYFFYLRKILLPLSISVDFAHTPSFVLKNRSFAELCAQIAALALCMNLLLSKKVATPYRLGLLIFLSTLLPVSGLLPFVHQFISTVACRYAYLAVFGFSFIVSRLTLDAMAWSKGFRWASGLGATAWLSVLFLTTITLVPTWQSDYTLFVHAVQEVPSSWHSHHQLGLALQKQSRWDDALLHFDTAARLNRKRPEPALAAARLCRDKGEMLQARNRYQDLIRNFPGMLNAPQELAELR